METAISLVKVDFIRSSTQDIFKKNVTIDFGVHILRKL